MDGDGYDVALLEELATALEAADTAVALTGAGLSAASGIPTFRGENGIWDEEFTESDFHRSRFDRDPAGFWVDRLELFDRMQFPGGAVPNAAHDALAAMSASRVVDAVITQNTDGLHGAAGTETVLELHGTNSRVRCVRCGEALPAEPIRDRVRAGENPPTCDCGGVYKPDVVLFGEPLPTGTLRRSKRFAAESDVFIVAGSSLLVEPAASLPIEIVDGVLAVVNLEPTRYADRAEYVFRADVTEVLPALAKRTVG